jgi:acetylornithine aminotransferase
MRAGIETLRIMEEDGLLANAAAVGDVLTGALREGLAAQIAAGQVKDIRGAGLMIGMELDRPCGVLLGRAAEAGLMISVTADSVIRLVPPLIMTADEARQVAAILVPLVRDFLAHG